MRVFVAVHESGIGRFCCRSQLRCPAKRDSIVLTRIWAEANHKVNVASVVEWSQRFRATGSAAAHKVGGRRPYAPGLHRRDLGQDDMTRTHGRAPRGERLVAKAPVCTENLIRVDDAMESPKLAE
jgi:hypothetical protein